MALKEFSRRIGVIPNKRKQSKVIIGLGTFLLLSNVTIAQGSVIINIRELSIRGMITVANAIMATIELKFIGNSHTDTGPPIVNRMDVARKRSLNKSRTLDSILITD